MQRSSYTVEFKLKTVARLKSEFNGNLSKASKVLIRSFEACGVAPMGQKVPLEHLNGRLKGVLGYKEGIEELQSDSESSGADDNEELDIFQDGN